MSSFESLAGALSAALAKRGYALRTASTVVKDPQGQVSRAPTRIEFPEPVFDRPFFAIGDVHLADGRPGDVFQFAASYAGPEKADAFEAMLSSMLELRGGGESFGVVQIGDWFDVWRGVLDEQPLDMREVDVISYEPIYRAYPRILELDAALGIDHVIGNHDAAFSHTLPNYRSDAAAAFSLGLWLDRAERRVFAMHGHQVDALSPPPNALADQWAVAVASILARAVPELDDIECYVDRKGPSSILTAIEHAFFHCKGGVDDPDPSPVARLPAPSPMAKGALVGEFSEREDAEKFVAIASHVPTFSDETHDLAAVLVGHSHVPRVSYALLGGAPVAVIDVGAWVYRQMNLALCAGDTAVVWELCKIGK